MSTSAYSHWIRRLAQAACIVAGLWAGADSAAARDRIAGGEAVGHEGSAPLQVEVTDGLLTLIARDVALAEVLEQIADRAGLTIVAYDSLDRRVTLTLHRLPMAGALRQLLKDESFVLQEASTAQTVGRTGPTTLWVFSRHSAAEREPAASGSTIPVLHAELVSGEFRTRRQAVKALRRLGSTEAIAPLSLALADDDQRIRTEAVYALADIGGDAAAGALATALADGQPIVRQQAAYALGEIGGDTVNGFLAHALDDEDREVRATAIEAFGDIGGERSASALAVALRDPDASLRQEAVDALGEIGGSTATRLLRQALYDDHPAVRQAALIALEDIDGEHPAPAP